MKTIRAILEPSINHQDSTLQGLVDRLNTLPEYCSIHPDFETVLIVSSSSKEGIVRVESICCEDFRIRLIAKGLIAQ